MNLMTQEKMKELILDAEGFEILKETSQGIEVYDNEEDRFLHYRYLEGLHLEELFQFNTLKVNQEKFFRVFKERIDLNMLMIVNKVVFVNNEEEYDALIKEYPEQFMDMKKAVGINFYMDNVIVINAKRIRELAEENVKTDGFFSYEEELAKGLWETIVHELRHHACENPIIPEEMIPIEEGAEEKVEEYCRAVFDETIEKHPDYLCFE